MSSIHVLQQKELRGSALPMSPARSLSHQRQELLHILLLLELRRTQLVPWRVQTVMTIVDTIVSRTNTQVADSAKVLQAILAAAANERGEWELPLSAEKALSLPPAMHADHKLFQAPAQLCFSAFARPHAACWALLASASMSYVSMACVGHAGPIRYPHRTCASSTLAPPNVPADSGRRSLLSSTCRIALLTRMLWVAGRGNAGEAGGA